MYYSENFINLELVIDSLLKAQTLEETTLLPYEYVSRCFLLLNDIFDEYLVFDEGIAKLKWDIDNRTPLLRAKIASIIEQLAAASDMLKECAECSKHLPKTKGDNERENNGKNN